MKVTAQSLHRVLPAAFLLCGLLAIGLFFARMVGGGVASPASPRAELWDPATAQTFNVNAFAPRVVTRVTSQNTLNLSTARYRLYNPRNGTWTTYVPAASLFNPYMAILTATNFPIWGAGEKITFFITPAGSVVPSFSPDHTIAATYRAFIPRVSVGQSYHEQDDNPCQAPFASPNAPYVARPDDLHDFFKLSVPIKARVTLTVTNFTVAGQMQLRSPLVNNDCSATTSTNIIQPVWASRPPTVTGGVLNFFNVDPGTYYARLSTAGTTTTNPYTFRWSYGQSTNPFEPNNTSCSPAVVSTGVTYQAYPNDAEDFYRFSLASTANVEVTLNNYSASGQYVLYRLGASCSEVTVLDVKAGASGPVVLSAPGQPAGTYLLRVHTDSGFSSSNLYSFLVSVGSVTSTPNINTCSPMPVNGDNCPADQTNGTLNVYWINAPGATSVRVNLNNLGAVGNCPAGTSGFDLSFAPSSTPSGSWSKSGINTGYYSLNLYISGPQGTYSRLNMPIKMNCNFMLNGLDPTPTAIGPQIGEPTTPATGTVPLPTPFPLPPVDVPEVVATPMP